MKKFTILTVLMVLLTASTFATVRTVSNVPLVKAQYSDIAVAISEATAGDTLYLMNTGGSYGTVTLTKALTLIGENWNTRIDILRFNANLDMLNYYIESLNIGNLNEQSSVVNNLIVRNCKLFTLNIQGTNWNIYNNYCDNLNSYVFIKNIAGLYFVNNIVSAGSSAIYNQGTTRSNCNFLNNIYIGQYNYWDIFYAISNLSFVNNIFYGADPHESNNCSFNNNITFGCENNTLPYGTNGGTSNLVNQDPMFVNAAIGLFAFTKDYRLATGSPAINAGLDGTDIGITGGLYPWKKNADGTLDMSGEPKLPKVISLTLTPKVININNQQMQINATGKKK